jgi:hypothetical protein
LTLNEKQSGSGTKNKAGTQGSTYFRDLLRGGGPAADAEFLAHEAARTPGKQDHRSAGGTTQADEPNNEELKEEIRSFDLLARKAYFTSRWQVKTGTWLLLFGGILMAVSLKIYTDLRARIEKPDNVTEELLRARANSQYWLLVAGGLILGLSLVAGILSNDFLKEYQAMGVVEETAQPQDGVEVIEVFPTTQQLTAQQVTRPGSGS